MPSADADELGLRGKLDANAQHSRLREHVPPGQGALRLRRLGSPALLKETRLLAPDWSFDPAELRAAFSNKTRAIIMNSPHNPTGKVFTLEELNLIA